MATRPRPILVLLLKTKSSPSDAYEELLVESGFAPVFVPVLEHRFDKAGVARLTDLLQRQAFVKAGHGTRDQAYGGLIFTSQRAVEAFADVVANGSDPNKASPNSTFATWPHLQDVPVYSVGPATTRALRAVSQQPPLAVVGEHTGNGEDLAYYIQENYGHLRHPQGTEQPPLLFLVGDKRRDIIPKVLASGAGRPDPVTHVRPPAVRIAVDEVVVYGTVELESFPANLRRVLSATADQPVRWVVVFSPTGCDSLLAALGRTVDSIATNIATDAAEPPTYVATIGPTTQAYLRSAFGFEPDVCAAEPTPAGVLRGIAEFMARSTGRTCL